MKSTSITSEQQTDALVLINSAFVEVCGVLWYNICATLADGKEGYIIKIGYARVSSVTQNEDRQIDELLAFGIDAAHIFIDKQSGKDFKRPQYIKLYKQLRPDDILIIKSIDRLGRNYREIQEEWRKITQKKKADIIVLDMPLLDTTKSKDLLGTFISDLVLQLLSFVAENERVNIRQRQKEGIAAAKRRGVKFGRPPLVPPDNFEEVYLLWKNKKLPAKEAAELCNMPLWAFYRKGKNLNFH